METKMQQTDASKLTSCNKNMDQNRKALCCIHDQYDSL